MDGDLSHVLLRRTDEVLASWGHRFDRSKIRWPRPVDPRQHAALVSSMVTALGEAVLLPEARLRPGAAEVRELEKAAALAGASLSASEASGFDVAALLMALRDAVLEFAPSDRLAAIGELFEWLVALAMDAFATAGRMSANEKAAEQLEAGTPVVLIAPEVPAVLLFGTPTSAALDSILGRALLLVVRAGAPALVLDVAALVDPASQVVVEGISRFFDQKRMAAVEVILSGASPEVNEAWVELGRSRGVTVAAVDRLDAAVARSYERAGYVPPRRRG